MKSTSKVNSEKENKVKIKKASSEPKEKKIRKNRRQRRLKDEIKHKYIPEHIVLSPEEIEKLPEQNILPEKLPYIFISDPGIRHLEVKVGDIIKIKRANFIVGEQIYYRIVVSEN